MASPDPPALSEALLKEHTTRPMTVNKIEVTGASHTRHSFLNPFFAPLVASDATTVADILSNLQTSLEKLHRYDIFKKIETRLTPSVAPDAAQSDVDIALLLQEHPRLFLRTGTELGNTEGNANAEAHLRNVFGGGEHFSLNASAGTRTRSAYIAEFVTPLRSGDPDTRLSIDARKATVAKPWASHEESIRAAGARLAWGGATATHTLGYSMAWRTLTGLATKASPTTRADAGDSIKSAIQYTFIRDRRDNSQLPQRGYFWRSAWEIAGWGPLGGDVAFSKSELELAGAMPMGLPGVSLGAGFRAGMLYPLSFGYDILGGKAEPSRLNDRFILGGPTDVRGFKLGGLGPRDGADATGGDIFAAGSVNLMLPVPRTAPDSGLRIQLFANAGRLVALKRPGGNKEKASGKSMSATQVRDGMINAVLDLCDGLPSTAFGLGLVYAHPAARFELNFALPWSLRRGEETQKGFQVGVGISFM